MSKWVNEGEKKGGPRSGVGEGERADQLGGGGTEVRREEGGLGGRGGEFRREGGNTKKIRE